MLIFYFANCWITSGYLHPIDVPWLAGELSSRFTWLDVLTFNRLKGFGMKLYKKKDCKVEKFLKKKPWGAPFVSTLGNGWTLASAQKTLQISSKPHKKLILKLITFNIHPTKTLVSGVGYDLPSFLGLSGLNQLGAVRLCLPKWELWFPTRFKIYDQLQNL